MRTVARISVVLFLASVLIACARTPRQAYRETVKEIHSEPMYSEPMVNLYTAERLRDAQTWKPNVKIVFFCVVPGPNSNSTVLNDQRLLFEHDKATVLANRDLVGEVKIAELALLEERAVFDQTFIPRLRYGLFSIMNSKQYTSHYTKKTMTMTSLGIDYQFYRDVYAGVGYTFAAAKAPHENFYIYLDSDLILYPSPYLRAYYSHPLHENWRPYAGLEFSYVSAKQQVYDAHYKKVDYSHGVGRSIFAGIDLVFTNKDWLLISPAALGLNFELAYEYLPLDFDYFGGPDQLQGISLDFGIAVHFYSVDFSRMF
jgi:hypothetical protein